MGLFDYDLEQGKDINHSLNTSHSEDRASLPSFSGWFQVLEAIYGELVFNQNIGQNLLDCR